MRRFELTDGQYQRIAHLLPGKPTDPGTTAPDNRLFIDAIPWIARAGAPWFDLPERFGKIALDALGNPVRPILTGGQAADVTQGAAPVAGIEAEHVIADKGYDGDKSVETIEASGAEAVIPPRSDREQEREYDRHLYQDRDLVERFIDRVK